MVMIEKIAEVNGIVGKLEELVRELVSERNAAANEVARLRKNLDDREMDLLQLDEQLRSETMKFEEELAKLKQEREDIERKFDELAERIRSILPLLPESKHEASDG
jgi:chromosome segregation ATPase